MASDQIVTAQDVLRAVLDLRRRGHCVALADLEQREPDLAEFLMEEVSSIHRQLQNLGGSARQLRRLTRRTESLAIVLVASLANARVRLWREDGEEQPTGADAELPHIPSATLGNQGSSGDSGSASR